MLGQLPSSSQTSRKFVSTCVTLLMSHYPLCLHQCDPADVTLSTVCLHPCDPADITLSTVVSTRVTLLTLYYPLSVSTCVTLLISHYPFHFFYLLSQFFPSCALFLPFPSFLSSSPFLPPFPPLPLTSPLLPPLMLIQCSSISLSIFILTPQVLIERIHRKIHSIYVNSVDSSILSQCFAILNSVFFLNSIYHKLSSCMDFFLSQVFLSDLQVLGRQEWTCLCCLVL